MEPIDPIKILKSIFGAGMPVAADSVKVIPLTCGCYYCRQASVAAILIDVAKPKPAAASDAVGTAKQIGRTRRFHAAWNSIGVD